jgi:hypothetical protein
VQQAVAPDSARLQGGHRVNAVIIGCLVVLLAVVARRLASSRAENSQLLTQIAALKRRLARRDL